MRPHLIALAALGLLGACAPAVPQEFDPVVQSCATQSALSPDAKSGLLAYYRPGGYPLLVNEQVDGSDYKGINTWKWDCGWVHLSGPGSEPIAYAMAYDPALHKTVLVGRKTMAWDGSRWSDLGVRPPLNLGSTSLIYDAARGVLVLVDSFAGGVNTWTFDGSAWKKAATGGPQNEAGAAVAYDPRTKTIVMFGGLASRSDGPQQVTWSWDGSSWSLLQPDTSPPGAISVMGYDEATAQMILVTQDATTWEWDGKTWAQLEISSPQLIPDGGMVYDSARRRLVLWQGGPQGSETWTYTGTWAQLGPLGSTSS